MDRIYKIDQDFNHVNLAKNPVNPVYFFLGPFVLRVVLLRRIGSWYQRVPVRYSCSVRLNMASARFGRRWAQATMIVFNSAIGATYDPVNEGLLVDATR